MATYICNECGTAENCDIKCRLSVDVGEPEFCPISGDVMDCGEWRKIENSQSQIVNEVTVPDDIRHTNRAGGPI